MLRCCAIAKMYDSRSERHLRSTFHTSTSQTGCAPASVFTLRQKQLLLKLCCFEYVINIALNTSRRARRSELGTFGCVYFCNRIYRKRRSFQITFRPQAARSRNVELSLRWAVRVRRPYATCFYFQRKVPYLGEMKQHRMEFSCMIL